MITRAVIAEWRGVAPWGSSQQVEQDLVISRALVAMFNHPVLTRQAIFRGGTALHKLFPGMAGRYSEDIDLVQREAGPIGDLVGAIRESLDPWLGKPTWKAGHGRFTLYYSFETSFEPVTTRRLKIEINTREHFSVLGTTTMPFVVETRWFSGRADVPVFQLNELLGTKMRALYQRRKGRDLFDLWFALDKGLANPEIIVRCFQRYMENDGTSISRAEFEANLSSKLANPLFVDDIIPLLAGNTTYRPDIAGKVVRDQLITQLPGDPWKGGDVK